jgi:hypothetical protein
MASVTDALERVQKAPRILFDVDPKVRPDGVSTTGNEAAFVAVRNIKAIVPLGGKASGDSGSANVRIVLGTLSKKRNKSSPNVSRGGPWQICSLTTSSS